MADLSELQSSLSVKIAGANPSSGTTDNYLDIDTNGRPTVKLDDGSGNALASSASAPTGTEQALIVRNIPSGTQAVSAASLPLPSGASTSALQTTGNSSLSSIDTKTPALGQALAAASVPVVLTASQLTTLTPLTSVTVTQSTAANLNATVSIAAAQTLANVTTLGTITNALPTGANTIGSISNISGTISLPTGASTSALQTTGNTSLSSIDTKTPTLGQKTMANSSPVVIASDQSALPIQLSTISLTNFSYDDMNVANGGIARATNLTAGVATTLYSYTGTGSIYGFILNLASLTAGGGFQIDLIVDGGHVFGSSSGINTIDLSGNTAYDIGNIAADIYPTLGWRFVDKSVRWEVPGGGQVKFSTSVVLKVTWVTGAAQKFNAGMIALIKGP